MKIIWSVLFLFLVYSSPAQMLQIDKNAEAMRIVHNYGGHAYISFWHRGTETVSPRRNGWLGFESDGNRNMYFTNNVGGGDIYLINSWSKDFFRVGVYGRLWTSPDALRGIGDHLNMQYDPETGEIGYDNSSRRYKTNILPLADQWNKIFELSPVQYNRQNNDDHLEIGYIAEEVDSIGLNNLVGYDGNGNPRDVRYDRMVIYLIEMMKTQQKEIAALKEQNRLQAKRILKLESEK